jgi:hypothetical protein
MNKKNKIEIMHHIQDVTEGMSFVFDRVSECVIDEDLTTLSIYGWIKNDFVVFLCDVTSKGKVTYWNVITSNKKHSKQICEKYFGGECTHAPCQLFEKWMEASE